MRNIRLTIKPETYNVEQRVEASKQATEKGVGVRMEVHSSHTEFWLDDMVDVGKVEIWMSKLYKSPLVPVGTLDSPDQEWDMVAARDYRSPDLNAKFEVVWLEYGYTRSKVFKGLTDLTEFIRNCNVFEREIVSVLPAEAV